ncbi:Glutamyl-tRNA(Gln) amidotransferase subunit A [Polystyrenella longa]|uniref:Glutamyl-tRNA(Gln) amidotransferase subunit A n=1 Tax=Polystyrenella longa TaxID=2528007 RepID=A0A518CLB3_9PLAN|nr:Asp-tRNA(Asn)/Glu-tRNA(Gln) amidotransferase subunit GatA [Polystyrenella longa]QDU79964.1 Glutamyl-tRNA(Gln) amidotransferase subunit A [Polystyrenella longa]
MSLVGATAAELLSFMKKGETTAVEVMQAHLEQISQTDDKVEAYVQIDTETALKKAADVDARRQAGESVGPLGGLPIAIKDVLCTKGVATTCSSKMLENFIPPYDATVIKKLSEADGIMIGKVNMDEFAMGSSTENSAFKKTRNPWNLECTPGGSSGGSAAAVAAMTAPMSLGSDTGGSIRQPAHFCGVVGMKPTYGRVSRYGLVAFASSLDQVGPLANDVHGAALLLEAISGHDQLDSTSVPKDVPSYTSNLEEPLKGLKIGIVKEHYVDGLDGEVELTVREAYKVYESLGAELIDISLPNSKYCVAAYYIIAPAEASSNLARYDGIHYGHRTENFENMVEMYSRSRGEGFGTEVKRRIMLGTYTLSAGYIDAYYLKALKVRRLIRNDFDDAFKKVDVIASPTSPNTAFKLGGMINDPMSMYLEDIYTISANLAGLPGISVPAGISKEGLPIGLQLVGAPFEEGKLLRAARMFEKETGWTAKRPEIN